jgi:hypothetical protein
MERRAQEKFLSLLMLASYSISTKLEELRNNLDPDDQLEPIGRLDPALMEDHINSNIGTPVQPILPSLVTANRIPTFTSLVCSCQCYGFVTFWYGCGCGSSDPYLCLTDPDSDPGSLKIIRVLRIRIWIRNTGKKS